MSKFDPNALLNTELQVEEIATEFVPIPEGDWPVRLGAPKVASGEKDGKVWARLEVPLTITDPAVAQDMGLEDGKEVKSMYTIFLDINQETQMLDFGVNKNVRLGQLFAAVGLEGGRALTELENTTAIGVFKQKMSENQRVRTEVRELIAAD